VSNSDSLIIAGALLMALSRAVSSEGCYRSSVGSLD